MESDEEEVAQKEETWLKAQNRGLPEGIGPSFRWRFIFTRVEKPFIKKEGSQDGGFGFCLFGEDSLLPKSGLFFDTASKKAPMGLLEASIGRGVFRGFWGNLPGLVGKLFHFSGASGETVASGVVSRAVPREVGSGPCSASITTPVLVPV